jgi:CheY-like chemotaxis protein
MSSKAVFVVDDDPDIRFNLRLALESESYTVFSAANGREALSFLTTDARAGEIGCILLDLMMPVMNGMEFLEELHSKHAQTLARIPVVVATAKGNLGNPMQISHAAGRIQKPMELDELYRVVEQYCNAPKSATPLSP